MHFGLKSLQKEHNPYLKQTILTLIIMSFNLKPQYLVIQLIAQAYKQWTFYLSTDPGISYTFGLLMNRERNNPKEK